MSSRVESLSPDLDAIGDWMAPEGSEPWAKALRIGLQRCVDKVGMYPDQMKGLVDKAIKYAAWTKLLDDGGKTFPTFDAFCAARQPYGLGTPYAALKPYLVAAHGGNETVVAALTTRPEAAPTAGGKRDGAGRPSAVTHEEAGEPRGIQVGARQHERHPGTTASYLSARIARDAPAVHEAMKAGKYPSVRAAAKAAGIIKDADVVSAAIRALRKVPGDRLREFVGRLTPEQRAELGAIFVHSTIEA